MRPSWHRSAFSLLALSGWLALVGGVAFAVVEVLTVPDRQWDLTTYYAAGTALSDDEDPYDIEVLKNHGAPRPFVYSPLSLPVVRQLGRLDWDTLFRLFLGLKVLALAGLAWTWRLWFSADRLLVPLTFILALAGFRLTVRVDLYAGNIGVFEALFIWLALLALKRGRLWWFTGLLSAVAVFKLVPLVLLPLAVVLDRRAAAWRAVVLTAVGWLGALGLSASMQPEAWRHFLAAVSRLDERAGTNVTFLAMLRDAREGGFPSVSTSWETWLFLLWGVAIVAATWRASVRETSLSRQVALWLCAYALVLPRFKDYAYVLLLPAAAEGLLMAWRRSSLLALLAAACLTLPLHPYQRFAALVLVWGALLGGAAESTAAETALTASRPVGT